MADEVIKELTPEQTAKFPEYVDKWTKIGHCCDPADVEAAKDAAVRAYEAAGQAPPKEFILCDSPVEGITVASTLKKFKENSEYLNIIATAKLATGGKTPRGKDILKVTGEIALTDEERRETANEHSFGSHDAGWLSFYDYFLIECKLKCCEPLQGLIDLSKSAGWCLFYHEVAIIEHRHHVLHLDEDYNLHCEDGPAVAYPDGFALYGVHGHMVDEQIIMRPETQTIDQITKEQNTETRRLRMERYGVDRYLLNSGAKPLDIVTDIDGIDQALFSTGLGMNVMAVACTTTERMYPLYVPEECDTVDKAQKYLRGGRKGNVVTQS